MECSDTKDAAYFNKTNEEDEWSRFPLGIRN